MSDPKESALSVNDEPAGGERPVLFVCDGDHHGPRIHPCRRVQESRHAVGVDHEKIIGGHGSPFPFLRTGTRDPGWIQRQR
jgi:hypothetical protein